MQTEEIELALARYHKQGILWLTLSGAAFVLMVVSVCLGWVLAYPVLLAATVAGLYMTRKVRRAQVSTQTKNALEVLAANRLDTETEAPDRGIDGTFIRRTGMFSTWTSCRGSGYRRGTSGGLSYEMSHLRLSMSRDERGRHNPEGIPLFRGQWMVFPLREAASPVFFVDEDMNICGGDMDYARAYLTPERMAVLQAITALGGGTYSFGFTGQKLSVALDVSRAGKQALLDPEVHLKSVADAVAYYGAELDLLNAIFTVLDGQTVL